MPLRGLELPQRACRVPQGGADDALHRALAAARTDAQPLDDTAVHGATTDAARATVAAGIAALAENAADARADHRDARGRGRDLGLPWDEALPCLDPVLLLGPDDPDAPVAADRTREVFTELGARPFLATLDAAAVPAEGQAVDAAARHAAAVCRPRRRAAARHAADGQAI